MKLEYAQRVTDRHLELMDDSDAFLMVYNDCLNDDGKREVHKYAEYLITRKEFLKPGISSLPDNSPDSPNPSGQKEAVKRVEELTEILRYQKEKNPAEGD